MYLRPYINSGDNYNNEKSPVYTSPSCVERRDNTSHGKRDNMGFVLCQSQSINQNIV